jgi:hypothetical protein
MPPSWWLTERHIVQTTCGAFQLPGNPAARAFG